MSNVKTKTVRMGMLSALLAATALLFLGAGSASAAPVLRLDAVSQSSVPTTAHAAVETVTQGSASPEVDEVQELTVAAGIGTYHLSFADETTGDLKVDGDSALVPLPFGASFLAGFVLQTELEQLPSIGADNIAVNGGPGGPYGARTFRIQFTGALAGQDVEQLTVAEGPQPLAPAVNYFVQLTNVGSGPTEATAPDGTPTPAHLTATLPPGFTGVSVERLEGPQVSCPSVAGQTVIECTITDTINQLGHPVDDPKPSGLANPVALRLTAAVDPNVVGVRTAIFSASGGGAQPTTTADPITISADPPGFGVDGFDASVLDPAGNSFTQAGGHPDSAGSSIDFRVGETPRGLPTFTAPYPSPAEPPRDIVVDLPPGLVGDPASAPRCSLADLSFAPITVFSKPLCAPETQVGVVTLRVAAGVPFTLPDIALYSVTPQPGAPARFGFAFSGSVVLLNVSIRNGSDYGVSVTALKSPEAISFFNTQVNIWGDPASETHDYERACPGELALVWGGPTCESSASDAPFLRYPTSCAGPLTTHLHTDSWFHPGEFVEKSFTSHTGIGYPWPESEWGPPQGPEGCNKVKFNPQVEASPTTVTADSPSGLDFHLSVPQDCWEHLEELCQSDLKGAEVTLPQGMSLNPSAAAGLGACSKEQIGYKAGTSAPFEFSAEPAHCPENSKIGTVEIATPLLARFDSEGKPLHDPFGSVVPEPLKGNVYLAKQSDNPFGSLLAMYIVAEGQGVVVKQAGEIVTGPNGRLTTRVENAPQTPFSDLEVNLFGGPRAPLRTPPSCGTFGVTAKLTPWSGTGTVARGSTFEINNCPNSGFNPKLSAGTENPLAGTTSPFLLRLTREDGTQEIGGLSVKLPEGLLGYLKGIAYCPDSVLAAISADPGTGASQEASPSCPAASRVGTVTVGAGAGANPFYTTSGRAYLAGPYKGAPVSIAVVAPAVAGPFDLGSVVVRNAIQVDPTSSQLTVVSDPLPSILYGIPLDIRDVRVRIDRDHFTLNPTSCDEMQIASTIVSTQGAVANPSQRFQVAGCDRLGFKPRLSLRLKGGTRRSKYPALTAVMRPREGNANADRIQVGLPHSEFLAQEHIRTICTRVQFAADACPKGSIYGAVTATSPILDYALTGNVYLRSSDHPLPDLVLALRGPASQPIEIDAIGRIDSKDGGIQTTFEGLPDAPLTKVVLRMHGGKKGLLRNSTNICRGSHRATVQMDGQNGKVRDFRPELQTDCGKKQSGGKGDGRRH